MKRTVLIFSTFIVALLVLFRLNHYLYLSGSPAHEYVIALIAIVFFGTGVFFSNKTIPQKADLPKVIDRQRISNVNLSKREFEVLQEVSNGLSNKEIAEKLFVTESTVKTHVSNILVKLNAKRRSQAIKRAKEYQIISS